jgi:hypothetical protein
VAVIITEAGAGDQQHGVGQRVAGDDELEGAGVGVEAGLDVGRGDVDDEDVEGSP